MTAARQPPGAACHDPKAPLRNKVCGLCEQPLERARKGECGRIWWYLGECFWVPTLRDYAPGTALKISAKELEPWL
jgi:hypothetical protein